MMHVEDSLQDQRFYELRAKLGRLRALNDYPGFMKKVLGIDCVYNNEPAVREYHEIIGNEIKDWLKHRNDKDENGEFVQKVPRYMMVVPPRKTFKTSGVSEVVPVFAACHDPNIVCGIITSDYRKLSLPIAQNIRDHFDGRSPTSRIKELFGEFHSQGSRRSWAGDAFTIDQRTEARRDPTVSTYSVNISATGHHFDVLIIDDPVTREAMRQNADYLSIVQKMWVDLDATMNPNGLVILIGTRYHNADLHGYIFDSEIIPKIKELHDGKLPEDWSLEDPEAMYRYGKMAGWTVIFRQAVTNPESDNPIYNFPGIWGPDRIARVRRGDRDPDNPEADEYSELFFQCQLQNTPHKRRDNPVKEIHVETARGVPDRYSLSEAPKLGWVDIHCDFAFKSAEAYLAQRGDWTVAHVVVKRNGLVWRLNGYRGKPTQDQFEEELIKLATWAKDHWQSRIRFLSYDRLTGQGSGDMSTQRWLQGLFRRFSGLNMPSIMEVARTKRKEEYILDTVWAWQNGMIRLCKEAPGNDQLIDQMLNIGYTTHDDDADAFAAAFHPDMYQSAPRVGAMSDGFEWRTAVDIPRGPYHPLMDERDYEPESEAVW